jgi:hypothetical protein
MRRTIPDDLLGRRFGRLVVTDAMRRPGATIATCACDCGGTKTTNAHNLMCGDTARNRESATHRHTVDAHPTPTYASWRAMMRRAHFGSIAFSERYIGRGIRVCERWWRFENFLEDMGERPAGKSIDRINNDGNYEPGNCRWATAKEQAANRRPARRHNKEAA